MNETHDHSAIRSANEPASGPEHEAIGPATFPLEAFLPESTFKAPPTPPSSGLLSGLPPLPPTRVIVGAVACVIAVVVGSALWLNVPSTAATPATGGLRVESDPAGADVIIDGTARGKTPMTITLVEGKHQLVLKRGTITQELSATITRNTSTVHHVTWPEETVDPTAARNRTGNVRIVSDLASATVSVDGVNRGTTPVTVRNLAVGEHQVVIRSESGTERRTVLVEAGATSSLVFARGTEAGVESGWLVAKVPVALQIFEDGKLVGSTETERILLPSGNHSFEFGNEALGFRASRAVSIRPGQTVSLDIDLPRAPINFNAVPWAQVWLDGESLGETPIGNVMTTIGPHEVIFRHPQLGERRVTTVVTLKQPARATVDLTKR